MTMEVVALIAAPAESLHRHHRTLRTLVLPAIHMPAKESLKLDRSAVLVSYHLAYRPAAGNRLHSSRRLLHLQEARALHMCPGRRLQHQNIALGALVLLAIHMPAQNRLHRNGRRPLPRKSFAANATTKHCLCDQDSTHMTMEVVALIAAPAESLHRHHRTLRTLVLPAIHMPAKESLKLDRSAVLVSYHLAYRPAAGNRLHSSRRLLHLQEVRTNHRHFVLRICAADLIL
jgi:hypothetical protein